MVVAGMKTELLKEEERKKTKNTTISALETVSGTEDHSVVPIGGSQSVFAMISTKIFPP